MPIKAVVFDVGETLVDESRHWGEWADDLGVSRLTFCAALGAAIARGWHHRRVFEIVCPDTPYALLAERRAAARGPLSVTAADFYPDALSCLSRLNEMGLVVGIAGNQPRPIEIALKRMELPVNFICSSESMGVEKPDPGFFLHLVDRCKLTSPAQIAYVGDRLDKDVIPACAAGLVGIHIRRGPWAFIQSSAPDTPEIKQAIGSLAELPELLRTL
jgi:FMN phosphatase YigB (HAD superfamily)